MTPTHQYELPTLSRPERNRRWTAVRQGMEQRGLDCLVAYGSGGNLSSLYLTQIGEEGITLLPLEGEPIFLLPSGERWLHWVLGSQDWVEDVRPVRDLAGALGDALDGTRAKRIGLVDFAGATARTHQQLMNALSDYETEDASKLVYELRLVKSEEEIAMMQRAAEIADDAIQALRAVARPGARATEVHAETFRALLAGGCEPSSHIAIETTPRPFHPVRQPSLHALEEGDVVVTHINPRYAGYFGHPHVCLTLGEPRGEIREMFRVCQEAFETFKAEARAGVSLGEVCRRTLGVVEAAGYDWRKEPLAHSIGLAQQEPPVGGVLPNPYPDFELVENQVFGLHPWVGRMAESIGIDSGRAVRITKGGAVPFGKTPTVELLVV